MTRCKLVGACLVAITSALFTGCSSDPGDGAQSEQEQGAATPSDSVSDGVNTNVAKGSGTWVFVTDRECRPDCVDRTCSCSGPICAGAPEAGLPCTFLGSRLCLVKRTPDLASVFYCEAN